MNKRIKTYSIGEVAKHSGVSVRMLRHYDEIGLLPAFVRDNGYRAYGHEDLERLQEILAWREMEFGLAEIAELMSDGDRVVRLRAQRNELSAKLSRLEQVLETLDDAIDHAEKGKPMNVEDLYKPFSQEKQTEYETWLVETYGDDMAEAIAAAGKCIRYGVSGWS
ncbi:MAG: MerR family transcriptional regulator [Paracoccaceae bacterium]|nr:MerR family transcriptional regulator [Paracoccaceae bacterium]MDG1736911.1 MerR family transcriptional regulator [Paracoccaceae bacterium]MDG2259361.1 MerR family transcriptional regulator [Paracoccaceae bacterium]